MNLLKTSLLLAGLAVVSSQEAAVAKTRWQIAPDSSIVWNIDNPTPHQDHIEMSGKRVSVVLRYGVDSDGAFRLNKSMVWPLLRTIPNNTHASLMRRYDWNPLSSVTINGRSLDGEKVLSIRIKGDLTVESRFDHGSFGTCQLTRQYFPSTD